MANTYTLTEKAVSKLKRVLQNNYVNTYDRNYSFSNTKVVYPHPFRLMYATDTGEKSGDNYDGAWIVYLPQGSVSISSINPRDDLSAAANYDGWYDLTQALSDMVSADYEDWTLIFDAGQRSQTSATSSDSKVRFTWYSAQHPNAQSISAVNLPIAIAHIKDDEVQQLVRSSITSVSGPSGGGMFAWDSSTKKIGMGGVMIGRTFYEATGTNQTRSETGRILYALKITLAASSTVEVEALPYNGTIQLPSPNDNISYIPIYVVENGEMKIDLRGCFVVPSWE